MTTALFSHDLLSSIRNLSEPLQVLLIGPVGSGKTTLITTLSTVLANEKRLIPIGALICDGSQHCTTEKKSFNMSLIHDKKDLKISFIDTIGMEKENCLKIGNKDCKNYEAGFVTALIRGYIKDSEKSTVFPSEEKILSPRAHVVVFVVSQRVYALPVEEKKEFQQRIRSLIQEVKNAGTPNFI